MYEATADNRGTLQQLARELEDTYKDGMCFIGKYRRLMHSSTIHREHHT